MKREKISNALSGIDEKYLKKAENHTVNKIAHTPMIKWLSLAACLALIITCTAIALPSVDMNHENTEDVTDLRETGSSHASVWWGEIQNETQLSTEYATLVESYHTVAATEKYKTYASMAVIDESFVGSKIDEIEIESFWERYGGEITDYALLRGEVYEIKGVSPNAAVCVRYLDKGAASTLTHYYVYMNTAFTADTLSDFFFAFNAQEHLMPYVREDRRLNFTRSIPSENGTIKEYLYTTNAQSMRPLCDMLLRMDGPRNANFQYDKDIDTLLETCNKTIDFSLYLPSAGKNISATVFDNGRLYLTIYPLKSYENIEGAINLLFDIGRTNANEIISLIEANTEQIQTGGEDITIEYTTQSSAEIAAE